MPLYRWDGVGGVGSVTVAHSFVCPTDGCLPSGSLLRGNDGDLYGIAQEGPKGGGVVFELGASHPGEASPAGDMVVSPNVGTSVTLNYAPACGATGHAIYWGTSPIAGALAWTNAACGVGSTGVAGFDPGTPPVGQFYYFVIVGQSAAEEGSYGRDSAGAERPEAQGVGACDRPQLQTLICP